MRLCGLLSRARREAAREQSVPADGTYMTDGASLFRVAGTLIDINRETIVELESCRTLELNLLPAARAEAHGLRPVDAPR